MTIRKLTSSDLGRLLQFYQTLSSAVVAFYEPFGPQVTEETILNHLKEADAGRHISLGLVGPDGSIEGHAFVLRIDTPKPVFGIGLQERVHGQGWGRKIMQTVLAEADARNIPLITLTVIKKNAKAKAMYEKFGFQLRGEETFREKNDSYYMERKKGAKESMDELDKARKITITGPQRDEAILGMTRQLKEWQIVMPPSDFLALDFGLGDFYRIGETECWIANEIEAGYCGKFLFVFDGQTCPMHMHKTKHETFYIVRGKVRMHFDGAVREMQAGDVLPVAPGKLHSFTGIGPALLLEVSKPCIVDDNYFENTKIPIGGNYRP